MRVAGLKKFTPSGTDCRRHDFNDAVLDRFDARGRKFCASFMARAKFVEVSVDEHTTFHNDDGEQLPGRVVIKDVGGGYKTLVLEGP